MPGQRLNTNYMTLTRFIIQEQTKFPYATGELTQLMNGIQTAAKSVSSAVRKAGLLQLYGLSGSMNVQGEEVNKLDVISNELFINMLVSSYSTCILVSEENVEPIFVDPSKRGKYIVCFDPLDGSSNIDCLGAIGSIFTVLRREAGDNGDASAKEVLQTGRKIVAAGYALYGSATMMVLSVGTGVYGFTLDPSVGEFILTLEDIKIKPRGNIYSINEGYSALWDQAVTEYVHSKKFAKTGQSYNARYIGSMVADVHRTLIYGGIFMYPATAKAKQGKLRLLYEAYPMAYLIEQAGGMASNGHIPILDVVPKNIHDRCPVFLGSAEDVQEIVDGIRKHGV